jgi:hypothetical protein
VRRCGGEATFAREHVAGAKARIGFVSVMPGLKVPAYQMPELPEPDFL